MDGGTHPLIPDSKGASGLGEKNWVHMLVEGWGCTSPPRVTVGIKGEHTRLQTVPGIRGGLQKCLHHSCGRRVWPRLRRHLLSSRHRGRDGGRLGPESQPRYPTHTSSHIPGAILKSAESGQPLGLTGHPPAALCLILQVYLDHQAPQVFLEGH